MRRLSRALRRHGVDLVMVAGAAAMAVGCGLIYLPAGLIVGGALAIAGAILSALGGDGT